MYHTHLGEVGKQFHEDENNMNDDYDNNKIGKNDNDNSNVDNIIHFI